MKNTLRKYLIIIIYVIQFLFSNLVLSQSSDWQLIHIRKPLDQLKFISQSNGMVFDGTYAHKTTDGGLTWSKPLILYMDIGNNVIENSLKISYLNDQIVWGVTGYNNPNLIKSTNGGINWTSINTNLSGYFYLTDVFFVNQNTGYAGGSDQYTLKAKIIKTTNGGLNWTDLPNGLNSRVMSIYFRNTMIGWITAFNNQFAKTTDGGITYELFTNSSGQSNKEVQFIDSLRGWILVDPGSILRTTNSGLNWASYNITPGGFNYNDMYFADSLNGWICGTYGEIYHTSNSGINWVVQRGYQGGSPYSDLYSMYFKDLNTGFISKYSGDILKTTNGGNNWFYSYYPPTGNITSIKFCNIKTGWIISDDGSIWKSFNGGFNWSNQYTAQSTLNSLIVIDSQLVYCSGNSGSFLKTTNSGNNWTEQNIGSNNLNSIFFINSNSGWVSGNNGDLKKTTNAGQNWITINSNTNKNLNQVLFINDNTGFVIGDSVILKSINAGQNWNILSFINHKLTSIFFQNPQNLFLTGNYVTGSFPPYDWRHLFKSTDFGNTWVLNFSSYNTDRGYFNTVCFSDSLTGWIGADDGIFKTNNSGTSWYLWNSTYSINNICFKENNIGWMVGKNSMIFTTYENTVNIQNKNQIIVSNYKLFQNYPNPFNPKTNIKYQIKNNSFVSIKIFDILGKEVETLVNEKQSSGIYEVSWDASQYPSGVYFYRLITDGFTDTKKMILLK